MSDKPLRANVGTRVSSLVPDPSEAPITPLGHIGGRYFVLTAEGELRSLTARDLEAGRGLYDLFVGGKHNGHPVEEWLGVHFPPKRKREDANADARADGEALEWSRQHAGEWIMRACVVAGIFDNLIASRAVARTTGHPGEKPAPRHTERIAHPRLGPFGGRIFHWKARLPTSPRCFAINPKIIRGASRSGPRPFSECRARP